MTKPDWLLCVADRSELQQSDANTHCNGSLASQCCTVSELKENHHHSTTGQHWEDCHYYFFTYFRWDQKGFSGNSLGAAVDQHIRQLLLLLYTVRIISVMTRVITLHIVNNIIVIFIIITACLVTLSYWCTSNVIYCPTVHLSISAYLCTCFFHFDVYLIESLQQCQKLIHCCLCTVTNFPCG